MKVNYTFTPIFRQKMKVKLNQMKGKPHQIVFLKA